MQGLAGSRMGRDQDSTSEADKRGLRLDFKRRLMLQFRGSTPHPASRELDDKLRLTRGRLYT
jgi:hypothetical protein